MIRPAFLSPAPLLVAAGALIFLSPSRATGQTVEARVGRYYDDSRGWTSYRLGISQSLAYGFAWQVHGDWLKGSNRAGELAGIGLDLTALRRGREGLYLVVGVSGGLGSETSPSFSDPWGSWSIGAGYDLFPLSFVSIGMEGRWRELSLGKRQGPEVGLGFVLYLGGGKVPSRPQVSSSAGTPATELEAALPGQIQSPPVSLADSIVATAYQVMGRPYEFGGTGANGEGFDCSGLIQYAYGKHGIALPRRSLDQARAGEKVDRKLEHLKPADLLTFSNRGGPVTHVGLYLGGGRFIHSASRGVQISALSARDPYGRWWYRRWVGVRRILR